LRLFGASKSIAGIWGLAVHDKLEHKVRIVGLTGGIGAGKSAAADVFIELGVTVIDTDKIAHQLTEAGGAANASIGEAFGAEMLEDAGGMARSKMRALVFADATARQKLEAILHPLIHDAVSNAIAALDSRLSYAVLAIPLLFERMTFRHLLWRTVSLDCSVQTQIKRVISRSQLATDEIKRIIAAQAPRTLRLQLADDVIHNEAGFAQLRTQIDALHRRYIETKTEAETRMATKV
jgi:dephospho-CoA kinase